MNIRFGCDNCDQHIEAEASMAGQSTRCPSCGHRLLVPAHSTLPAHVPPPSVDIYFHCVHCEQEIVINAAGAGLSLPCPKCGQKVVVPWETGVEKSAGAAAGKSADQISFECQWCHRAISVEPARGGKVMTCPQCDRWVTVPQKGPAPKPGSPGPSRIDLTAGPSSLDDEKKCPTCGGAVKKTAVACKHCGQELTDRLGPSHPAKITVVEKYRGLRAIALANKILAILAIFGGLAAVLYEVIQSAGPLYIGLTIGGSLLLFLGLWSSGDILRLFVDLEENTRAVRLLLDQRK